MTDLHVGVLGASGALGTDLLAMLDVAPWRPDTVTAAARAATDVGSVSFGDADVAVDDVAHLDLGAMDLAFLMVPPAVAGDLADRVVEAGVPLVDLTGHALMDLGVPIALPWLGAQALSAPRSREMVTVPGPVGAAIATALASMTAAGWKGRASATAMVPASLWGRHGIAELSQQVVSLFNSGTPQRRIFEGGLAFDLMPQVGTLGGTGWTGAEVRAAAEIARLTGLRCDVTLVGVPTFSGLGIELRLDADPEWSVERVARALENGGVEVVSKPTLRGMPRPRKVEGSSRVTATRIRRSTGDDAVQVWLAADNLRLTSTAAIGLAGRMLRDAGKLDASA